jgi:hypothetical protein
MVDIYHVLPVYRLSLSLFTWILGKPHHNLPEYGLVSTIIYLNTDWFLPWSTWISSVSAILFVRVYWLVFTMIYQGVGRSLPWSTWKLADLYVDIPGLESLTLICLNIGCCSLSWSTCILADLFQDPPWYWLVSSLIYGYWLVSTMIFQYTGSSLPWSFWIMAGNYIYWSTWTLDVDVL